MQVCELSNKIKNLCKNNGISVRLLLENCDINRNFIYDLEKNGQVPSFDKIIKIANYLGCSIDYLAGITDNPNIYTHKGSNRMVTLKERIQCLFRESETVCGINLSTEFENFYNSLLRPTKEDISKNYYVTYKALYDVFIHVKMYIENQFNEIEKCRFLDFLYNKPTNSSSDLGFIQRFYGRLINPLFSINRADKAVDIYKNVFSYDLLSPEDMSNILTLLKSELEPEYYLYGDEYNKKTADNYGEDEFSEANILKNVASKKTKEIKRKQKT